MGCAHSRNKNNTENSKTTVPSVPLVREFTLEETEILGSVWGNLRESTADSGLYILQHFFTLYPGQIEKFEFNLDEYGNVRPNFLISKAIKDHSLVIMNGLDSVIVDVLKGRSIKKHLNDIGYDHLKRKIGKQDVRDMTRAMLSALRDILGDTDKIEIQIQTWRKFFDMVVEEFGVGLDKAIADRDADMNVNRASGEFEKSSSKSMNVTLRDFASDGSGGGSGGGGGGGGRRQ